MRNFRLAMNLKVHAIISFRKRLKVLYVNVVFSNGHAINSTDYIFYHTKFSVPVR